MRILVCIKQVADAESRPVISEDGSWASYGEDSAWKINRFDEHAVEEALLIREKNPGTEIDILSIGPERSKNAIRRCLEMGADSGFLLFLDNAGYTSPSLKARLISDFSRTMNYDLILTGVMSEDMMSGQTGPMIAALLGIPSATSVIALNVDTVNKTLDATRELDGGGRSAVRLTMPALVTVQSGINRPRYPSLSNVMRAKTAVITEIRSSKKLAGASYETVKSVTGAGPGKSGMVLTGTTAEKARALWQALHKKSLI